MYLSLSITNFFFCAVVFNSFAELVSGTFCDEVFVVLSF